MSGMLALLGAVLLLGSTAPSAYAQTPTCDGLSGYDRSLAAELLASQRPYDCCDDTLENCLKQKPTCSLAVRLSENICRRVAEKQARAAIVVALRKRSRSMSPRAPKAEIDLTGLSAAGDESAPITLVEYACPRCPYCAWITPEIHDAVAKGPLKGKVKLYLKTFPIRGHRYAKEGGLAFLAAERLGHFWQFVLHFYRLSEQLSIGELPEWAEAVGMDRGAFEQAMADPVTLERLVEIKKEGIVGGVRATPTFFMNGRMYHGDLTLEELVDVLEEEFNRINGIRYRE